MDSDTPADRPVDIAIGELLTSSVGLWRWDVARKLIHADGRFAELHGLEPNEVARGLSPAAFFAAIHPEDRIRVRIAIAGVMQGVEVFQKQYRLATLSGGVRWVLAQGSTQRDSEGNAVIFSGVATDISAQKRVEERLQVAQSAGGVGTFEYLSGFGTAHVSEQFCKLLGLSPTDQVALRSINARFEDTSIPFFGGPSATADEGMPYREFKVKRADTGEVRWIAQRGEVRPDAPGGGLRYIGVIYDITAIKNVEDQLRDLTVLLGVTVAERTRDRDRVWNNSRDLLAVMDTNGDIRAVNPSWTRILGYDQDELLNRNFAKFVVTEDTPITSAALIEAASGKSLDNFINRCVHRSGGLRWIAWQTSFEDQLIYAFGRDVTDEVARTQALKQTEDQLRQAQKMEAMGQLTGGIAHDFNNMLMAVMGGLDLIRRRLEQGRLDDIDRFMDAAMTSAQRAAGLTHRLLAFARQQSLDPKAIQVDLLLKSMEELLTRTLGEQTKLRLELSADLWAALSDTNQLESAILNLAINARDAMPDGGLLLVTAENISVNAGDVSSDSMVTPGDYVLINVTDTGEGMPPDVMSKAFDPFFTTKPIGQGTGLGLSMVYGFMRQIGGHVTIESTLGTGTSIKIYLPRAVHENSEQIAVIAHPANAAKGSGQTILLVEDETGVRELMVDLLTELGYEVLQAAEANAAIAHLRSNAAIALLVTDVGLPGLNGRQLAEIARASRPELRVLFVTGYAAGATIRSEFLAPGMEMISKPFALDTFANKVNAMLAE